MEAAVGRYSLCLLSAFHYNHSKKEKGRGGVIFLHTPCFIRNIKASRGGGRCFQRRSLPPIVDVSETNQRAATAACAGRAGAQVERKI